MNYLRLGLWLSVLIGISSLAPLHATEAPAEVEWEPNIYPHDNLFPCFIIGTARGKLPEDLFASWPDSQIGDPQGIIGIMLAGAKKGQKVEVSVKATDFFDECVLKATLKEDANGILMHPKVPYNFRALSKVDQPTPVNLTFSLKIDGEDMGTKTTTVTLRSINDCLFGVVEELDDEDSQTSDYSWLFASYVNENHPWVDKILKEALETGIVTSFDGYQSNNQDQVLLQVFAIWNVMQRRGLRYSDITTTSVEDEGVYSQHVRLFDESLNASQANCVDGTVLLTAVLRKIGLDVSLVLVPGHMFLAFSLDDETLLGLETTLMGADDLPALSKNNKFLRGDLEELKNERSFETFLAALDVGTQALVENSEEFENGELTHQIINLSVARNAGILPIASGSKE
ncbi:MAG: hypothetical protein WEB60_07185 [Terrimicrobiaceae bacterium]